MRVRTALAAFAALAALGGATAHADGPVSQLSKSETQAAKGVTQSIALGDGGLHLDLVKGYVFIPAPDVPPILKRLSVSGPSATVVGAVAPAGKQPGAGDYWISVLSYDPVGNVPETGADELGALTFIDDVKAARPANPALKDFAVTPAYDPVSKTLTWAEDYAATSSKPNALRHEQRLLSRSGDAGVTTIGRKAATEKIKAGAKAVAAMCSFTQGARYSDFVAATDRVSDYNLPGLIDGKRRASPPPVAPPAPAAVAAFNASDLLPGGKYGWASYLAGGLAALLVIAGVGRAVMSRRSSVDTDVT